MLRESPFIKPVIPKTEILARPDAFVRLLQSGWIAQAKIKGQRMQLHIFSNTGKQPIVYDGTGSIVTSFKLSRSHHKDLIKLFTTPKIPAWTALDCVCVEAPLRLYVIDILRYAGRDFSCLSFPERHQILPQIHGAKGIHIPRLIKTLDQCEKILSGQDQDVSGLVFRSTKMKGFPEHAAVKCRKSSWKVHQDFTK